MDISRIILPCKRFSITTALLAAFLTGSVIASPTDSTRSIKLNKLDHSKPATKLEVIAAVKKTYSGRILSVRKNYKARGNDCHHVRMIDKNSELILIRVACN